MSRTEGTASTTTAEVQARALVELISDAATRWGRGLIALDEFSAVAGRLRIYEQTERWRSLGLAVQLGAQSWESLGPTQDERLRLAGTAAGGVFVMRSPNPEDLCSLAGTSKRIEIGRKIVDGGYGDEGPARLQDTYVVDPNKVRAFLTGQAAFIEGNAATYLQVAPYRPLPYALPATRHRVRADAPGDQPDAVQTREREGLQPSGVGACCTTSGAAAALDVPRGGPSAAMAADGLNRPRPCSQTEANPSDTTEASTGTSAALPCPTRRAREVVIKTATTHGPGGRFRLAVAGEPPLLDLDKRDVQGGLKVLGGLGERGSDAMTQNELAELLGLTTGGISQLYHAGGGRRDNRERRQDEHTEPETDDVG